MNLSVVVPIFEERDNIQPLYEALSVVLARLGGSYEIIFVDDGSRDGSAELLGRLVERDRCVKVIEFRRNFGQTAAMYAGIQNAGGEVIVTRHHPRCAGVTKYGLGQTFRVLMDLAVVQFMIRYFASPMRLFGGWGLFWGLLGLAAACGGAVLPLGAAASSRLSEILLLGGILGMATGVQLAMLGLLGEVLTRSWFEGHGRSPGRIRRMLNFDRPALSVVGRDGKSIAA